LTEERRTKEQRKKMKRVGDKDTKLPPAEFERSFPVVRNKNRLNKFHVLV